MGSLSIYHSFKTESEGQHVKVSSIEDHSGERQVQAEQSLRGSEVIQQKSARTKHQHYCAGNKQAIKLRFLHVLTLLNQDSLMTLGRPNWLQFGIQISNRITITHNCKGGKRIRGSSQ